MSELMSNLLELINQENSIEEISEQMNLSYKQIYHLITILKNKGFMFDRKYYYDGKMFYLPRHTNETNEKIDLYSYDSDKELRILLVSDLHLGSQFDNVNYINMAFDYCKKKNINVIISGGDLIDGAFGKLQKQHNNIFDQVEYALKSYPHDKEIHTFTVMGDHDNLIDKFGINFSDVLTNRRHDIVPLGYGRGVINIKNDLILVKHPYEIDNEYPSGVKKTLIPNQDSAFVVLEGHRHILRFDQNGGRLKIYVPSLSDIQFNDCLPSFIDLTLVMHRGYFQKAKLIAKGIVENKIITTAEAEFELNRKNNPEKKSSIEEEKVRVREKSPIDKFNNKWGN